MYYGCIMSYLNRQLDTGTRMFGNGVFPAMTI